MTRALVCIMLALVCGASSQLARAQVHKCTDASGKSVYQDSPCDGSVPMPATKPPVKLPVKSPEMRMTEIDWGVRNVIYEYSGCTRKFPELAAKFATGYYSWRSKNAAAIEKVQALSEYAATMKSIEEDSARPLPTALRDAARAECEYLLERALFPPKPAGNGKPGDAWDGMIAALRAGDIEKALKFVSPGSREKYRQVFTELGSDGTASAATRLGEFRMTSQMGEDLAFGVLTRKGPDGKPAAFEVDFMRDRTTGVWYIESM